MQVPELTAAICAPLSDTCRESLKSIAPFDSSGRFNKSTYREVSFILCKARRAAEEETKTGSSGSITQTDTSLSLSLCHSLSRSRSFSRSLGSLSLIPGSLSCCHSLRSFSVLLSRTLSRSRSLCLSRSRSRS